MKVVVDTREQRPWTFEGLGVETVRGTLKAGDYSVPGFENTIAIERKSIDDWCKTVLRERSRFYRELELLRGYEFRAVIIEIGVRELQAREYRADVAPSSLMGFVAEVTVGQCVPVYLGGTRAECQILAMNLLRMAAKKIPREAGRG